MADVEEEFPEEWSERRAAIMRAADELGLLGPAERGLEGRFSGALIDAAKRISGIKADAELVTYALAKVALEDDFAEKLLARWGTVPRGTFYSG
jgi:hypothetical protein